ncbi:MAG: HD domain-containing protein [Bacteroides sp.]|nr:HD domain-containing protein [Bacteroides sp.]MCM1434394.1 HD domain-containing protein [Clostridiales bacterium]
MSLSALLHDVDDYKISSDTYDDKSNAVGIMKKYDIPQNVINHILNIISQVSFSENNITIADTIEAKCVRDADCLDAMGAIGIARAFAYGGSHNREMHNPDIKPKLSMSTGDYRNSQSTTINHFYEKLLRLKDKMCTNSGRVLADKRHQYMLDFLNEFFDECSVSSRIFELN